MIAPCPAAAIALPKARFISISTARVLMAWMRSNSAMSISVVRTEFCRMPAELTTRPPGRAVAHYSLTALKLLPLSPYAAISSRRLSRAKSHVPRAQPVDDQPVVSSLLRSPLPPAPP